MLLVNINDDLSPWVTRKMISLYPREVTAGRHWWTLLHMGSVLILAYLLIGSFIDVVVLGPDPRPGSSGRMDLLICGFIDVVLGPDPRLGSSGRMDTLGDQT